MPTNTPNAGLPQWDAAQASPWTPHNKALRILDVFATKVDVERADLSAPPGSCADGACFLVNGTGSGDWLGHDGEVAIAVGANAVSGWYFAVIAFEGRRYYNRANGLEYRYDGAAWNPIDTSVNVLGDLADVDLTGLADGFTIKWDASNQVWYAAAETIGSFELDDLGDVDTSGLANGYVLKWNALAGLWEAAPDTDTGSVSLNSLNDVDTTGLADGYTLVWDASNQVWYTAPQGTLENPQEWAPNFTADGNLYIPCIEAMTIDQGNAKIGTGTITFEKSTTAAPGTFASTTLPATIQAGAWLKVIAAGVSGFVATHLIRTA